MDIITQGLVGAIVATSAAGKQHSRLAIVIGFCAGLLADADILIRAADDPLFSIEYHRHFTHALLFVPIGGLIAALLTWPFVRRHLGFGRTCLYTTLGYLPSGLLDACTSFGTQLLWPFADTRIAWNLIAIVDPVFSLSLIAALLFAWRRRQAWPARLGLGFALLYLLFGLTQRERAEEFISQVALQRGHVIERLEVKPTLGNLVLWRAIYETGGRFHIDAVRVGPWSAPRHYPGGTLARFTPRALPNLDPGSVLAGDIARVTRLSDDSIVRPPARPDVLGDARYAMLPHSTLPLWGIALDLDYPDRHVQFLTFRHFKQPARREFLAMLRGLPLPGADSGTD